MLSTQQLHLTSSFVLYTAYGGANLLMNRHSSSHRRCVIVYVFVEKFVQQERQSETLRCAGGTVCAAQSQTDLRRYVVTRNAWISHAPLEISHEHVLLNFKMEVWKLPVISISILYLLYEMNTYLIKEKKKLIKNTIIRRYKIKRAGGDVASKRLPTNSWM